MAPGRTRNSAASVEQFATRWLAGKTPLLKPKTADTYEGLLRTRVLPELGRLPLGRLDPQTIQAWVGDMVASGLSASRTRQAHALLGEVLAAAVAGNYLARSPCQGIDLPRLPQTEMAFLDAAQVSRLAQAADPYASLVEVLCYCGLRWGKAIALKRRRCDLLRGRLEIAESVVEVRARPIWGPPKNHQTRTVSLPGFVRDHLAERLAGIASPDGLVWTASRGGVLRLANWRCRVWLPALEQAGLSAMRIHDCRHTAAALMIATGAHPKAVHTALGHASIAITMDRYGHLYGDELDRIAAALDAAHRDDAQRSATQTRPTSTPRVIPLPNSPAQQGGGRS